MTTNERLWARAQAVMPGGVNSPVRSFRSVGGGTPYFVARAEGASVWDADGLELTDYVQSYGASILGHAHPAVVEAVQEAATRGTTYGAPTEAEVLLAEEVCRRVPGVGMVRMTSSGTEATMSAIRLARGATGRSKIVKFDGCYHGHADALLAAAGSGVANQGLPGSAGVPAAVVADTLVVPYNEVPEVSEEVAVVCVEPVAANMGLVPPAPGFLDGLRLACDQAGALLLFDEVITGFRLAVGGATETSGVVPDLWCFGKVIGGGLPVGMFAASPELMANVAPLGPVYQGGTLSGNPLATAAGLAVLGCLDAAAYQRLEATATRLQVGLQDAVATAGLPVQVPRHHTLVGLFAGAEGPVTAWPGAKAAAGTGLYSLLFRALLKRGVAVAPGPYEVLFPSLAHDDDVVDKTLERFADACRSVAEGRHQAVSL
ncbi:MAG: Glutamate-1-semialdehyde 2,1-aminomutase [uncultured Acidimicrobiales bacterium]|uniref:Glutamate-1-semialdehyde 2,1-aminomutase n=1 Tax=uncultured Acidimicrobiales bacterium TaxID=310071 RepID=A0A6J4IWT2_9ACTN|nr:MAG: Glutamate-1-semialdehyde 2,1-aminomutase [uncultured Acidimicrobiales bacterium]